MPLAAIRCGLFLWLLALIAAGCDRNVVVGRAPAPDAADSADASARHDAAPANDGGPAGDGAAPAPADSGSPDSAPPDAGPAPDAMPASEPIMITWRSGAHSGNELQTYLDFGSWRGRTLDLATVYPDRTQGWDPMVNPGWPVDMMRDFPGDLVLSLPLYPPGMNLGLNDCADGAYDPEWRRLGPFMIARNRGDSIIRLGWGWNDLDHEWHGSGNVAGWKACFRRVVLAIRAAWPEVKIEWSFNPPGHPRITNDDPYAAYPGDDVVDYVSLEAFDMYPPARNQAEWDARCAGPGGVCRLIEFARQHGKLVGLGEWGVAACGGDVGRDNPFYIQAMLETLSKNRDAIAYEAYFEEGQGDVCSSLRQNTLAPLSAARYREIFTKR